MRYLLAIILPPVAVLMCGKPFQAILNVFLCAFYWIPGVIHAWIVVANWEANNRSRVTNTNVVHVHNESNAVSRRDAARPTGQGWMPPELSRDKSLREQLLELNELREESIISDDEYQEAKQSVLKQNG